VTYELIICGFGKDTEASSQFAPTKKPDVLALFEKPESPPDSHFEQEICIPETVGRQLYAQPRIESSRNYAVNHDVLHASC
jgi:hypothetical protein